jgi:hypothetical protein
MKSCAGILVIRAERDDNTGKEDEAFNGDG